MGIAFLTVTFKSSFDRLEEPLENQTKWIDNVGNYGPTVFLQGAGGLLFRTVFLQGAARGVTYLVFYYSL